MDDSLIYPRPKLDDDEHNFFLLLDPKVLLTQRIYLEGGFSFFFSTFFQMTFSSN